MILVTTGTQLPFPRLARAIDRLAPTLGEHIIVQNGLFDPDLSNVEQHVVLEPLAFDRLASSARLMIAHAGIGSILDAARFHKPLIIVPRRHELGEHRNDHQLATARRLVGRFRGISVAWSADDLPALIAAPLEAVNSIEAEEADSLYNFLKTEIGHPTVKGRSFLACVLNGSDKIRRRGSLGQQKSADSLRSGLSGAELSAPSSQHASN